MEKDSSQTQPLYPLLKSDIPHYQHGHLTKQIIGCAIEVHRVDVIADKKHVSDGYIDQSIHLQEIRRG